MSKNNYLFYKDYFKNKKIDEEKILISKTNNSYLIGPLIDNNFKEEYFYKRIISNAIYSIKIYKRIKKKQALYLIGKYAQDINSNEILEVYKNGKTIKHIILPVPKG